MITINKETFESHNIEGIIKHLRLWSTLKVIKTEPLSFDLQELLPTIKVFLFEMFTQ